MLRWLILGCAFVLWAGCMALVYTNFKAAPRKDMDAENIAALDRVFDPNAPLKKAWKIYTHPADLEKVKAMLGVGESDGKLDAKRVEWNGVNEKNLIQAGRLESVIKKDKFETSLDEITKLTLSFPNTPFSCAYNGESHVSHDKGLEYGKFKLLFKYDALKFEALSSSMRDGGAIVSNLVVTNNGQRLFNTTHRQEVGGNAGAGAELEPFQYRRDFNIGTEWQIQTVDLEAAMKGEKDFVRTLKVKCVARRQIMMEGVPVSTYEVRSENGEARAWYSADGEVLKQSFKLAGVMDVMVVKEDDYSGKKKD